MDEKIWKSKQQRNEKLMKFHPQPSVLLPTTDRQRAFRWKSCQIGRIKLYGFRVPIQHTYLGYPQSHMILIDITLSRSQDERRATKAVGEKILNFLFAISIPRCRRRPVVVRISKTFNPRQPNGRGNTFMQQWIPQENPWCIHMDWTFHNNSVRIEAGDALKKKYTA